MDDLELNPEKYEGKKLSELSDEEEFDEENSIEYSEAPYKKTVIPKVTLVSSLFFYIWNLRLLVHLLAVVDSY